jgi:hypothetical protein
MRYRLTPARDQEYGIVEQDDELQVADRDRVRRRALRSLLSHEFVGRLLFQVPVQPTGRLKTSHSVRQSETNNKHALFIYLQSQAGSR